MSGGNMKFGKLMGAAVTAAAMMMAAPVQAATYIITYTGHVTQGYDNTGTFGVKGALAGLSYTAIYSFNFPVSGALYYNDYVSTSSYGGTSYNAVSPLSANFTLNGITKNIAGNYVGSTQISDGSSIPYVGYDTILHAASDLVDNSQVYKAYGISNYIYSSTNNFIKSNNLLSSLDYYVSPADFSTGGFGFVNFDRQNNVSLESVTGNVSIDHINITAQNPLPGTDDVNAAVPEPATWALMIVGFGAIGSAMRRRQRPRCAGLSLT